MRSGCGVGPIYRAGLILSGGMCAGLGIAILPAHTRHDAAYAKLLQASTPTPPAEALGFVARGLDRLNPDGLTEHFTTADGLALGEPVTALRDRQGALSFGNMQGLSRWIPEPPSRNSPPPILIRGVRVRGVPQPISELGETTVQQFSLASGQNQMQFDFTSVSFRPAEKRRFQYMLEGADTDWRTTEARSVNYASLTPGPYRFLVRAMDSASTLSLSPSTAAFTILPPYWQRCGSGCWPCSCAGPCCTARTATM